MNDTTQTCAMCGSPGASETTWGWFQHGEGAPIVAAPNAITRLAFCPDHMPEEGRILDPKDFT